MLGRKVVSSAAVTRRNHGHRRSATVFHGKAILPDRRAFDADLSPEQPAVDHGHNVPVSHRSPLAPVPMSRAENHTARPIVATRTHEDVPQRTSLILPLACYAMTPLDEQLFVDVEAAAKDATREQVELRLQQQNRCEQRELYLHNNGTRGRSSHHPLRGKPSPHVQHMQKVHHAAPAPPGRRNSPAPRSRSSSPTARQKPERRLRCNNQSRSSPTRPVVRRPHQHGPSRGGAVAQPVSSACLPRRTPRHISPDSHTVHWACLCIHTSK